MDDIKQFKHFLDDKDIIVARNIIAKSSWKFMGVGTSRDETHSSMRFWIADLISHTDYISNIVNRINMITGKTYQAYRVFANGQTYGQEGYFHTDSVYDNSYTFLMYINDVGPHNIDTVGGFTQIKGNDGEIININPYLGNAVMFDSKLIHRGLSPARQCIDLRITIAFNLLDISEKLEKVEEEEISKLEKTLEIANQTKEKLEKDEEKVDKEKEIAILEEKLETAKRVNVKIKERELILVNSRCLSVAKFNEIKC